ncbi:uncharacterized protein LOC117109453 isoform X2 [Anneissia japonica]|nr:uncharacterized protein LOC117109453 isoform X2 [Anneissia japonica]XP_033107706.1 uncharacterized protein LOC117109453 isoform X2 [Anneissia japonica]
MTSNKTSCGATVYHDYENEKIAVLVHIIIYSIVFALLAIISLVCLIRLKVRQTVTPLVTALFVTISAFCIWRFLYIVVDRYGINHRLHPLFDRLLADLPYPFVTSSFALLIWFLVQCYKPRRISRRLFAYPWIFLAIGIHFGVVSVVSMLVVFTDTCIMLTVCHFLTLTWSLIVIGCFIYILRNIIVTDLETRDVLEASRNSRSIERSSGFKWAYTCPGWLLMDISDTNPKIKKLIYVSRASISLHVVFAIITTFAMLFLANPAFEISDEGRLFTIWFTYETMARSVEAAMVLTLLYLVAYKRTIPSSASIRALTQTSSTISQSQANLISEAQSNDLHDSSV